MSTPYKKLPIQTAGMSDIAEETDPTPAAFVVGFTSAGSRRFSVANLAKAFRAPSMTQSQIDSLTPSENAGLIVLNTSTGAFQGCNGSGWLTF